MTALIGGREFAYKVVGVILGLYVVVAGCWVINWLFLRRLRSEGKPPENGAQRDERA